MKVTKRVIFLLIILAAVGSVFLMARRKPGMALDEYFSYGLSNSTYETNHGKYCIYLPQGVQEDPRVFFDNYFFASGFSIEDVWANQSYDVHPPMFYLILHALGRLTHNAWGFDTGIVLNALLHVINILLIYILIKCIMKDEFWAYLGSVWYAFLPVVLEHAVYIRMYYLMSTCCLGITLWMILGYRFRDKKPGLQLGFYVGLGVFSIFGVLTHYYFAVYLFFICLLWGLYLIYKRKWLEIIEFLVAMVLAGISCLVIFPGMKYHILHGNRGQQSIDSLLHSNYVDFLVYYGKILGNLAGGFLIPIVILGILFMAGFIWKYRKAVLSNITWEYMIVIFPVVLYYLAVSKMGVIWSSRFISPLFGVAIIAFIIIWYRLEQWIRKYFNIDVRKLKAVFSIMVIIIVSVEWFRFSWNELSIDNREAIEIAKQYGGDNDCFYIWELSEDSMISYDEFIEYNHIYFWEKDTPAADMKGALDNYDHLVIYFNCIGELDQEKQKWYLDEILKQSGHMTKYTHLYDGIYNCAYYLE